MNTRSLGQAGVGPGIGAKAEDLKEEKDLAPVATTWKAELEEAEDLCEGGQVSPYTHTL